MLICCVAKVWFDSPLTIHCVYTVCTLSVGDFHAQACQRLLNVSGNGY